MTHDNEQFDPNRDPSKSLAARIAASQTAFDMIRLRYPPQTAVVAQIDRVRLAAVGRRPGAACGGAMLVADFGVGKTESILRAVAHVSKSVPAGDPRVPILHLEMSSTGTPGSIPTAILAALGAPRPDLGREDLRWLKAVEMIRKRQVELIVVDEFNRAARRPTMSRPIVTAIREKIMDAGVAPVVFVGSEEAGVVLRQCPEVVQRLDVHIDLPTYDSVLDMDAFIALASELDSRLVDDGLLILPSDLGEADVARALCQASSGYIRRLMKIVRHAMTSAIDRGAPSMKRADLKIAVDEYAVRGGMIKRNPFA